MSKEIAIPSFSASDFTSGTAPYEFLYKFKDNPFQQLQLKEKMAKYAASVGIRTFSTLWNTYIKTVSAQSGIIVENVTNFTDQELELASGEYVCDDFGVTYVDRTGYDVEICSHPIMPVQRLVNVDSGEERLRIAYKRGRAWKEIVVEKSIVASQSKILELANYGIAVDSSNAKALGKYLLKIEQLNYTRLPEEKSVGRLGWINSECFSPYVEGLEFDGDLSFGHIFNSVTSSGSYDEWKRIMLDLRKGNVFGRLLLASSFASVIIKPCGLLPFFVHAWGGTECGKTVGLMIAASVWGNPKLGEYITTFNSTAVAQELQAGFLNSLPMCLDELQIQSSQRIKDFDAMIYQLTEGVGRLRGAKTGGLQKNKTWHNCIITNGEHPISNASSGGGALNRVIEFECTEKIYHDLVGICAVIQQNYGFAGREFVDFLMLPENIERVKALQKEFYKELLNTNSTDKQAASASAILTADKLVTELIFKDGRSLKVTDIAPLMTDKNTVDVNKRALDFVFEMIARNSNNFISGTLGEEQRGEVWGQIDDGYVYIIKSVFDREMLSEGFNSTSFLSWAKRKGFLMTENGRITKKKRMGRSGPVRCVCLARSNLNEWFESENSDDFDTDMEY